MTDWQLSLLIYGFFWSIRLVRLRKLWNVATLRGPDWFFDLQIQPVFDSELRDLIRRFRVRVIIPSVVEAILAAALFILNVSNPLLYFTFLIAVGSIARQIDLILAGKRLKELARQLQVMPQGAVVSSVAFSLKPRRLRDYSNWYVELLILVLTLSASGALWWQFNQPGGHEDFRLVLGRPLLFLYISAGAFLFKFVLIGWRGRVPTENSETYDEINQRRRLHLLSSIDGLRIFLAIVMWQWVCRVSQGDQWETGKARLAILIFNLSLGLVFMIWAMKSQKQFVGKYLSVAPPRFPEKVESFGLPSGRFCWRPDYPTAFIPKANGHAINLASRRNQAAAFYVLGLVMVLILL